MRTDFIVEFRWSLKCDSAFIWFEMGKNKSSAMMLFDFYHKIYRVCGAENSLLHESIVPKPWTRVHICGYRWVQSPWNGFLFIFPFVLIISMGQAFNFTSKYAL